MPQFKTLNFPNTLQGQQLKNQTLSVEVQSGWKIIAETITPGKFRGGDACCLFMIFAPCALLAGHTPGTINVTLQHDSDPPPIGSQGFAQQILEPSKDFVTQWKQLSPGWKVVLLSGVGIFGLFFLLLFTSPTRPPSPIAESKPMVRTVKSPCEVIGHWAAVVTVYCPRATTPETMAAFARTIRSIPSYGLKGFYSIYLYSSRPNTPQNVEQFTSMERMPQAEFDRIELGYITWNSNPINKFREFRCKQGGKLVDCTSKLK